MNKNISIIGGDLRIVNLAKILKNDGFNVYTYGLELSNELTDIKKCKSLSEVFDYSDFIVSSIPISRDNETVYSPYSEEKIYFKDLKEYLKNKMLFAGKIPSDFENENCEIYDLLKIEEYSVLNAIATAEGAIQIAMEKTYKTLLGSNILILGFGRIGKILAKMLYGIGANVFCEARKNEDLAYIKGYGYKAINLNQLDENLNKFDIIINNIPAPILDKNKLDLVKEDVLIIDLASNPGGTDFEYAKLKNINAILELGLPGKVAPMSSAEYIQQTIYNIIKNKREE